MDLMQAFNGAALEFPLAFRDRDNWCQFKAEQVSFASSSAAEAAKGARGSVIDFDAIDGPHSRSGLNGVGDDCFRAATWAHTAASQRSQDPESNLLQLHIRPGR